MKRYTVFLTEKQIDAMVAQGKDADMKTAELFRRAVDQFLAVNPTPRAKSERKIKL